jgi:hypothetical protein
MIDPPGNGGATGDNLRALEDERYAQRHAGRDDGLESLRELSRAWHENRSTAYLLGKSWSDPLSRWFIAIGLAVIALGWTYLWMQ